MKKIQFCCLITCFMLLGHSELPAQKGGDSLKTQLAGILNKWHHDAAEGNHAAYIGAMAADGVFIGTDASEYWTTAEFSRWCKPHFDKKKTWNFTTISRNIYTSDDGLTAWFDELLDTKMGICRGSGVIQNQEGQWKIAQYVLSATIPNEIMKKVTAMKSGTDSMLIIKSIFDKYGLTGTMLILNPENGRSFGYNAAKWDSSYLPASTFKIANSLIGLEIGVIDTGFVFKWNGEKRKLPQWDKDLSFQEAFRVSCVPCFQELARKIGPDRMISHLKSMNYPGMDVNHDNIDIFWLEGKSRITPRQQVDFISRLYRETLPLKKSVMQAVKNIMVVETTPDYTLSGKTGWAVRNGNNYGWFTGYIETKGKVSFIATMVEPKDQRQTDDFSLARKTVTMAVLRYLGIINSGRAKE